MKMSNKNELNKSKVFLFLNDKLRVSQFKETIYSFDSLRARFHLIKQSQLS